MLVSQRVEVSDSIEAIYEEAYEKGWTDGLPIIPPTEDRVQAFVDYVGRDPGEVVAEIPPGFGVATVEKIAVNAVMAGCRPEYFPVLLAAIEAAMDPKFNLNGIQATTNPATPMLIINGPIRDQLGLNYRSNCLGQGWRANATIGRALRLVLVNIGGAIPGPVDKATQGQPSKYSFCCGENEEENPWVPLHVERGFAREESTVTVVGAAGNFNVLAHGQTAKRILTVIAHTMSAMGSNNMIGTSYSGEPLIVLCPTHATIFAREGFSKADVKQFIFEHARLPLDWFPPEEIAEGRLNNRVIDNLVPLVPRPEDLMVVVAGGPGGLHSVFVPTFGNTLSVTRPINAT